nr:hypothetical protein HmN_000379800 [Hymenolepis microstoma]
MLCTKMCVVNQNERNLCRYLRDFLTPNQAKATVQATIQNGGLTDTKSHYRPKKQRRRDNLLKYYVKTTTI